MEYFYELFTALPRQGPGCRAATLRALRLLKDLPAQPRVLDIGCGCGMQTLVLAKELKTKILAIDNHRPFLDQLGSATVTPSSCCRRSDHHGAFASQYAAAGLSAEMVITSTE